MTGIDQAQLSRLGPVRLPKMSELIAQSLRQQIVVGDLKDGDALPSEAELLTRFQVSRPTLREAFRVLESESLIVIRRGAHGGARVQEPNLEVAARYAGLILAHGKTTLDDVYEARIVLEPPIVGKLALTRTDEDIVRLRAALDAHDCVAGDDSERVRTHTAFHSLLIELAGNQTLRVLAGMVRHIIEVANVHHVEGADSERLGVASRRGLAAHHRVVDLIEAGGQLGAEELWRKHLVEAREYMLSTGATTVRDLVG